MSLVAETQIAEVMDLSTKGVRLRAVKEGWSTADKPKKGGSERFYLRDLLPFEIQSNLIQRGSITADFAVSESCEYNLVPEKSKKIGLAKYQLIHAYRIAKDNAGWGEKGKAAQEFLLAYNSGLLLPKVFNIVGETAEKTLHALDKKLRKNNDDYLSLCDGRGGWKKHGTNRYKGRCLSEPAKAAFLKCYLNPHKPSVLMSIKAARLALEEQGLEDSSSDKTYRRWLKDYEEFNSHVICIARDGMKSYKDKYAPYITRDDKALKVGDCLVADGKVLNYFVKHPVTGNPCRMILIVFLDWASRCPAGWVIMPTEDALGISIAFRNAC